MNEQLWRIAVSLVIAAVLSALPVAQGAALPVCPADGGLLHLPLGDMDESPRVAVWHDLTVLPASCHITLQTPAALTIVLSGRFSHTGPGNQIAERLGAISRTKGLPYWSVTDGEWRTLVSDAFALDSSASDAARPSAARPNAARPSAARKDFTGQEMLSGQTLFFAQNDTRSWGLNLYSIRTIESSAERLVFESENVSSIKLGPVTLFEPGDVRSVLFLDRLDDATWQYFSLAVISRSSIAAREKSLINRQLAFYRFLVGQEPDKEPPLAP